MHMWSNQGLAHRCRSLWPLKGLNKPTYVHFISNFHSSQFVPNVLVVSLSSSLNLFSCDMIEYLYVSKNLRSWFVGHKSSKAAIYMEPLRHIEVVNLDKWVVQKLSMTIGINLLVCTFRHSRCSSPIKREVATLDLLDVEGTSLWLWSMGSRMVKWTVLDHSPMY